MATTTKEKRPGFTETRLSQYFAKQVEALNGIKTQREIANDLGYDRANIISMFKSGEAKIPLEKLPALARSLGVDLGILIRLGMEQYMTDEMVELNKVFNRIVTENEMEIVETIREATNNSNPRLDDSRREEIAKLFSL